MTASKRGTAGRKTPGRKTAARPAKRGPAAIAPVNRRARALLLELLKIPGASGREEEIIGWIVERLLGAGAAGGDLHRDRRTLRSPYKGSAGNLALVLLAPPGPRRMLGPRRHGPALRRGPADRRRRLHRPGGQGDARRGPTIVAGWLRSFRRPGNPPAGPATSPLDLFVDRTGGGRPTGPAVRRRDARPPEARLQLRRRIEREADDRRHRRISPGYPGSRGSPSSCGQCRKKASAPWRWRRWPSLNCRRRMARADPESWPGAGDEAMSA